MFTKAGSFFMYFTRQEKNIINATLLRCVCECYKSEEHVLVVNLFDCVMDEEGIGKPSM